MNPVLLLVRWGLPLGLLVSGIVIIVGFDIEGVGEALIAASVCLVIASLLFRFSFTDLGDRRREEDARDYYDEHGHWPGEPPDGRDG